MRRRRGRMAVVLQIKRASDEDDDGIVVIIIVVIARCGRRRQQALAGDCRAITSNAAFIAVHRESIALAGAVMAILRTPVALGRRKANRSISKELRQAAADRAT